MFPKVLPAKNMQQQPDLPEWTEEEIAAIRVVLQKLSTIRIMNSNDAEDLVQETLLTLIAKCPKTTLEKGPLVWSMGIFRKKVGNYYRKVQRYTALGDKENDLQQHTFTDLRGIVP